MAEPESLTASFIRGYRCPFADAQNFLSFGPLTRFFGRGYPPLPGDKSNGCSDLAAMMDAKYGQTKGLSLNLGKQTVYVLNAKPRPVPGLFFLNSIYLV